MRRLLPDAFAVTVLALFLIFFYWGFLLGRCFIWEDTLTEFYPGVNYFAKSVSSGRFPLWFPGVRDGLPFFSDPQMSVFYPLQWLLVPFVRDGRLPFLVYQRYIFLHFLLGGLFMYAFLKQLKLNPIAALSGAIVFCFSGFASLRIVNFVMIQVYVWLPLQLLCVHGFTSSGSRWAWLGLVGAMLMSLFAGHQQTTVYCWYLIVAYWLYRCYSGSCKDGRDWGTTLRQLVKVEVPKLVGTYALVFGMSAVMVLPTAENWLHTTRPSQSFEVVADTSLPYHDLLTLFVPNFFGSTRAGGSPVGFWGFSTHSLTVVRNRAMHAEPGFWQYWEFGAYTGQIFWLAFLLILFNWRRVRDKRTVGFFLVAWAGAIWFMLGRYGGLFNVLYYVLPGASLFRGPAKMSCVATLAAAILTAHAVDLLWRREEVRRLWPVFLPTAGYVCLLLVLFLIMERFAVGPRDFNRLTWSWRETFCALMATVIGACAAISALRSQGRCAQVMSLCVMLIASFADFRYAYGSFQCGYVSPDKYHPKRDPLLLRLQGYREQLGPFRFGQITNGQTSEALVAFQNLSYFHDFLEVSEGYTTFYPDAVGKFQAITNEAAKLAIQNIKVVAEWDEQNKQWLGRLTNSLPRATFFGRICRYESRQALLTGLEKGEIDWRSEVAVCEPLPADLLRGTERDHVISTTGEIQFTRKTPEEYSIAYTVSRPGVIFVSQTFYPGWVANGGRIKLIEVFGAFQGIVIPQAGRGQIVVRFSPPILKLARIITALSAATVVCLAIFGTWGKSSTAETSEVRTNH